MPDQEWRHGQSTNNLEAGLVVGNYLPASVFLPGAPRGNFQRHFRVVSIGTQTCHNFAIAARSTFQTQSKRSRCQESELLVIKVLAMTSKAFLWVSRAQKLGLWGCITSTGNDLIERMCPLRSSFQV